MHASFILGQFLFAGVTFFKVRPNLTDAAPLPESTVMRLFAVSLVACVAALFLRRRVPVRPEGTSPDLFWTTAQQPAMITWIPLEAAGLFALVSYFESASPLALTAAAIPVALLIALNPWRLERR